MTPTCFTLQSSPGVYLDGYAVVGSFTTLPVGCLAFNLTSFQVVCTGSLTVNVTVQGSLDPVATANGLDRAPRYWTDRVSTTAAVSASNSTMFDIESGNRHLRLSIAYVSGTGTLGAFVSMKGPLQ